MEICQILEENEARVKGRNQTCPHDWDWASSRAAHNTALIDTLIDRGVNISAVYDGTNISFKEHVVLNEDLNKLFLV